MDLESYKKNPQTSSADDANRLQLATLYIYPPSALIFYDIILSWIYPCQVLTCSQLCILELFDFVKFISSIKRHVQTN